MLRDLIINGAKAPDAMHKAKVALVTGMAVVKEDSVTDKFANISSTETVADIYFVDKERIPTGINTAKGDMSDYDEDFVNIKANEFVTLDKYIPGERFATDQFYPHMYLKVFIMTMDINLRSLKYLTLQKPTPHLVIN